MKTRALLYGAGQAWRFYGFAIVMAVIAVVPGINFFAFSLHGGVGWLILPFVFPVALIRLFLAYRRASEAERPHSRRFALYSIAAYIPVSFIVSLIGACSITRGIGAKIEPLQLWTLFTAPFGFVLYAL